MNNKIEKTKYRMGVLADITFHTDIAHRFFRAGWHKGNIGLLQFCAMIARIYGGCRADDPYADWHLMKSFKAITHAVDQIMKFEELLIPYFNKSRAIKFRYVEKNKAWNETLRISTEFCHLGAELLTNADQVIRQLITLQRAGITQSKNEITIKMVIRIMQDSFATPMPWRKLDVTRADVREQNNKFQEAKALYEGDLPIEVLNKEIEFSFLPKVINPPKL